MDELSLIYFFCHIDVFCNAFEFEYIKKFLDQDTPSKRWRTTRESRLCLSELMTLALLFHKSNYRTLSTFISNTFKQISSHYFRVSFLMSSSTNWWGEFSFLFCFPTLLGGNPTGIGFVDSTVLSVCHICRASGHKDFKRMAKKGKQQRVGFMGLNYI